MIELTQELRSVGLPARGMQNGEPFFTEILSELQQAIANAVIAAHEKVLGDPEWVALKTLLEAESAEWLAYVEVRKSPICQQRESRYRNETDTIRMRLDEDFIPNSVEWLAGLEVWKKAKNVIRDELPYPDSEVI
jgi:hypothetical protein